jgi:ABC-2 type transport system ATP-binding protein
VSASAAFSEYAIETEGLTKVFRNRWSGTELRAVDDVSLRVPRGSTYGLLGPNGAGKTTFVKVLLSCAHPTAGSAKVFGRDTREAEARRPIGYLPENHRFPTYMTGWSMLDFYGALSGMDSAARQRRIPELLAQVGLDERAHHQRLGKYSKGMLQRVGLAQALMHAPQLLVLDEPSDGVDPVGRKQIRDVLTALEEKGVTIFINSHLLQEVELFCHDVAIIQRGRLALSGSVKELTNGSGYSVEALGVTENLRTELASRARSSSGSDKNVRLTFETRGQANEAVDLLRANHCEIESFARTRSTLEEVFIKTVEASKVPIVEQGRVQQ